MKATEAKLLGFLQKSPQNFATAGQRVADAAETLNGSERRAWRFSSIFKDAYAPESLELPAGHTEASWHRGLTSLIAIELKVERFKPEHLGEFNFHLEALDRELRKPHENPAIGLLLCASKDDEMAEYSMSRTLSPALVAQYQTQFPDKRLLAAKLHECYALSASVPVGGRPSLQKNKEQ
jgi:YhcG PDDEXK nuclease domain